MLQGHGTESTREIIFRRRNLMISHKFIGQFLDGASGLAAILPLISVLKFFLRWIPPRLSGKKPVSTTNARVRSLDIPNANAATRRRTAKVKSFAPSPLSPVVTQRVASPPPSLNGNQNSAGATSLKVRYVAAGTLGTESTVNSGPKRLPRMSRPPDLERLESAGRYF
jgi:hypothetical protein